MSRSPVALVALVLDAAAPADLSRFWTHALGWNIDDRDPTVGFRVVVRSGAGEKLGQNRIHFDLTTASPDDQHDSVAELLVLGASHRDIGQGPEDTHVVLADPEGNEFCVLAPYNRFLSGCPRLGAVNCDGTRALGHFFSAALRWPLVWDQDEETAIQAPGGTGPKITWSGPPLMPRWGPERFHFHLAPSPGVALPDALDHLLALGATRAETTHACPGAIPLVDVDGNGICLVAET